MNKVICDVCGSKYPETAEQCPICGCAKPENARVISDETTGADTNPAGSYTYVKGGRFSKANVRKRNKASVAAEPEQQSVDAEDAEEGSAGKDNKGLVIAVVGLLLAIVAVMLFIFFRYFAPGNDPADTTGAAPSSSATETTLPDNVGIPCTGIELTSTSVTMDAIGDSWLLNVQLTPADTTDAVSYSTENTDVISVTSEGRITAVAVGEATVCISCGEQVVYCTVVVTDSSATTESTVDETTAETTEATTPSDDWKLNRTDISFTKAGDSWNLLKGTVPADAITYTTDDPTIATIEKGVVTAVGPGITSVHAEYNGVKYSCIIRCRWEVTDETTGGETEATETTETTAPAEAKYALYINGAKVKDNNADVTIKVGERFTLILKNEDGDEIAVDWTVSKDGICTIKDGTVTGKTRGETTVSVTHGGVKYSCIIRVKNK